jgi:predicted nicotinamide N-methyase
MPGYSTRILDLDVAGDPYRLRVLSDLQQFADPDGRAEQLGISSAQWPLFGQLWPSGQRLAEAVHALDTEGLRVLELGCGIGLASLVLQRRGTDVVASDMHPLAESFLAYNAALNGLPALHYRHLQWDVPLPALGCFDLIIASDVLYEVEHARLLGDVVARHANPRAQVLVTDPGRGNAARLGAVLAAQGFTLDTAPRASGRARLLHYRRGRCAGMRQPAPGGGAAAFTPCLEAP